MSKLSPQSDFKLSPKSIDLVSELKQLIKEEKKFILEISNGEIKLSLDEKTDTIEKIEEIVSWIKNIKNSKS